ncbi:MAG: FimV/HubP family polar landmark protein [Thiohalomonadales bacterium]
MIFDFRTTKNNPRTARWGKEMFHKTTKMLCILLIALLPINVFALGFGKIKTNSALNEIMDAEIPLLSATKSDIGSLEVKLASPEVFERFGTDRPNLLSLLKFEVKQKSGLSYIKITSKKQIREPFLDFWLEMNSKNERIIKNFVVLLDPPHLKQADAVSVIETPAATEIEPEPIIEETVNEPQASPFSGAEAALLDEPATVESAREEALFPASEIEQPPQDQAETADSGSLMEAEPDLIEEPEEVESTVADAFSEPTAEDSQAVQQDNLDRQELEPVTESEALLEPVTEAEPETLITDEPNLALEDTEAESFADDDGLFPRIPLSDYSEPTEDQFDAEPAFVEQPIESNVADFSDTEPESMVARDESEAISDNRETTPVGDLDYGITKKNDNLWQIAEKLRAGSSTTTVYQIMMALLQSNPDAFIDNNVHRLKVGYVLRVEDKGLLTQMTQSQAIEMYQDQTEQWQNYRQNIASNVETQAVDTSDMSFSESGSVEDPDSGELTLVTPESNDAEVSTGVDDSADAQQLSDLAILRDDLKRAISEASTSDSQNPELSKKLLDLEDEINSMQRMLTVEDDELASLQQQLHEINERNAATAEQQAQVAIEEQLAQSNPEDVGEPEEINQEQTMEGVGTADAPEEIVLDETTAGETSDEDIAVADDSDEVGIVATIMGVVAGVLATLMNNIIYIGGAVAALILLILTIVMLKRRNSNKEGSNESILIGSEENDISISDFTSSDSEISSGPVSAGVDSTSSEESSFLSDFAISGMNAIEEDNEVDPLTEADVFMAYGRYEAAEERLQDAIKSDPNRSELKLKLIELYYTTKNKESFESTAEEFYASLGGNAGSDPMWEKVLSMGAEIAPDNPIFSGGTPPEDGANVSSASMSKSDVMDIGLDTGVFDSTDLSATDTSSLSTDLGTDTGGDYNFDLGIDTTGDLSGDLAKEETSGLEFDLNLDTQDDISSDDDSNSLDFNLDSTESTEEISTEGSSGSMEFSLDSGPESELMDLGLDESNTTAEIDASGLDFDLPTDNDINLDDDLELSSGMDEVGTKLDLAKAYIDMGDSNGARSILDEVIDEGNDSQKQEAQELIHQIV